MPADLILTDTELRSGGFRRRSARAVSVQGGRILAVGAPDRIGGQRGPGTRVIRLGGGCLLPGFVDAHLHFRALVRRRSSLDCTDVGSAEGLLHKLSHGARRGGGGWLFAHGLEHRRTGFGALPGLAELDRVTAGRPLWLRHRGGHLGLYNSAALRALGCLASPPGEGTLERRGGRLTGVGHGMERWVAARLRSIDPVPPDERDVRGTAQRLLRCGVTAFADLTPGNGRESLDWWSAQQASGAIPQAVSLWGTFAATEPSSALGALPEREALRIGGEKIVLRAADGTIAPGSVELAGLLDDAAAAGLAVAVHAVESDAVAVLLDALRRLKSDGRRAPAPLRLEHLNSVAPPLLDGLAQVAPAVCVQPGMLWESGALYRDIVPPGERSWLFPLGRLRRLAAGFAIGSDAPAAPLEPLRHAAAAVTRRDASGGRWGRAEAIPVPAALEAITAGAPRVS
ncbi:MAG: amidohydrolase family protein, partial [SAR324 cluster bacterium]|nr:amidohydrolase family protein [SAR324 cluster bacterium]